MSDQKSSKTGFKETLKNAGLGAKHWWTTATPLKKAFVAAALVGTVYGISYANDQFDVTAEANRAAAKETARKIAESSAAAVKQVNYSNFVQDAKDGKLHHVRLESYSLGGNIAHKATATDGNGHRVQTPVSDRLDFEKTMASVTTPVPVETPMPEPAKPQQVVMVGGMSQTMQVLLSLLPPLIIVGGFVWFIRNQAGANGGGGGSALSFGKSNARVIDPDNIQETLADVYGADSAKEELQDIIDYIRDPEEFNAWNAELPRGILFVGPPGTGKTMLARTLAKEGKRPFFSMSGSEFTEMFVGVGAARVRNTFAEAREKPSIIFIDEIDAIGKKRGSNFGSDEAEKTLNQLLAEMDGMNNDINKDIIVIAATNLVETLDSALLRPGRFDKTVTVGLPDRGSRKKLLQGSIEKMIPEGQRGTDIDVDALAAGTQGWAGANLKNLIVEAKTSARRMRTKLIESNEIPADSARLVMQVNFDEAWDNIQMGPVRKTVVMSDATLRETAYHEAGHGITNLLLEPVAHPVVRMSIEPRDKSLGVTISAPMGDVVSMSQEEAEAHLTMLLAGRAAELITFEKKTTGAGNDIERATDLAKRWVTQHGWSDLGPINLTLKQETGMDLSPTQQNKINVEVSKIINNAAGKAEEMIKANLEKYTRLAEGLFEFKSINRKEIDLLVNLNISQEEAFEKIYADRDARKKSVILTLQETAVESAPSVENKVSPFTAVKEREARQKTDHNSALKM